MQKLCFNCFCEHDCDEGLCPCCGFDLDQQKQDYPVALTPGTMLNNRYYVGRVLGQGGFGITYVALDANINAKVAVKEFMPSELATRLDGVTVSVYSGDKAEAFRYGEERFLEEAKTLAQFIGNPNIAGVSNYFTENQTSYFVMDYIEGVSFKSYIASMGGKVPLSDALNVMMPVLTALCAVHREGFIHRDVTPDNIFITKNGGVKLLDFGSARYSVGDRSKSLDVILKVGYAPREQYIRRGRQGPFTDVYSCAACLYASLTGFLPPESLERMDQDELVAVSEVLPDTPDYINAAILKGLAVNAEDRFQSAQEFLDAIESQTVVEIPTKQIQDVQTQTKKSPVVLIAGVLGACLIGACAMFFLDGSKTTETIVVNEAGETISVQTSTTAGGSSKTITVLGVQVDEDGYFYYDGYVGDEEFAEICSHPEIKEINLWDADTSELSDISPVANLTELIRLDIGDVDDSYNKIETFAPLENLTNLEILRPGHTVATDVDYLSNLTSLTKLYLSEVETTDLSFLSNLTALKQLQIRNISSVTSLKGLENLTNLQYLYLNEALSLVTMDGFGDKPNLIELYIFNAPLEDMSAVSSATSLEYFNVSGSRQTLWDISFMSSLTNLKEVYLYFSDYEPSLEVFANTTNLQTLYFQNGVRVAETLDLTPLANLTELRVLTLGQSPGDLSPLANLTKLTNLDLYSGYTPENDLVTYGDLSPLSGLTSLRELSMSSNYITSIAPLASLESLTTLTIARSNITDTSALSNIESLRSATITSSSVITNKSLFDNVSSVKITDANG